MNPVKLRELAEAVPGSRIVIEEHGQGEALYLDRGKDPDHDDGSFFGYLHGLNIVHLTEPASQWPEVRAYLEAVSPKNIIALLDRLEELEAREENEAQVERNEE